MSAKLRVRKSASQKQVRLELEEFAGHRIRRLQQTAVATFTQDADISGLTPVQFAVLYTLSGQPGIDQKTLAETVKFDTSTIGSVVDRLESRGLLVRGMSATDRRVRLLTLTEDGMRLLRLTMPAVVVAQARILDPLSAAERGEFMRMMALVIAHHETGTRFRADLDS